jgi:hypothetical protein
MVGRVVFHAGFAGASLVFTICGIAAWLVLRPLANGVAAARHLAEHEAALRETETAALGDLGLRPRPGPMLDIVVPALVAVPAVLLAVTIGREYFNGIQSYVAFGGPTTSVEYLHPTWLLGVALTLGVAAIFRLAFLGRSWLRGTTTHPQQMSPRRFPRSALSALGRSPVVWTLVVVSAFMGAFGLYGTVDTRPPDARVTVTNSPASIVAHGRITLRWWFSEPAGFVSVTLRGNAGTAPQDGQPTLLAPFAAPASRGGSVGLQLTADQRRWLRDQGLLAAWLDIVVQDVSENHTRLILDL